MYVDLNTMEVCTHHFLQKKYATYQVGVFTKDELAVMNAALLDDSATGDVATGKVIEVEGSYQKEYRSFSVEEILSQASAWVTEEMAIADIEINKAADGHSRSTGTVEDWRTYRNNLRDYIVGGVISTSKPTRP